MLGFFGHLYYLIPSNLSILGTLMTPITVLIIFYLHNIPVRYESAVIVIPNLQLGN